MQRVSLYDMNTFTTSSLTPFTCPDYAIHRSNVTISKTIKYLALVFGNWFSRLETLSQTHAKSRCRLLPGRVIV